MTEKTFKDEKTLRDFLEKIFHTDSIDTMYDKMQILPAGGIALPVSSIIYRNKAVIDLFSLLKDVFLFLHVKIYETNISSKKALDNEALFSERFKGSVITVIDNSKGASLVYAFYMEDGHINDKIMSHLIRWLCIVYMIENEDINDFILTDTGYIFVKNRKIIKNTSLEKKPIPYIYMLAFMHMKHLEKKDNAVIKKNGYEQYIGKI